MLAISPIFFFLTIVQQDLVGKLFLVELNRIIDLVPKVSVMACPGREGEEGVVVMRVPYPLTTLRWWAFVEGLTGCAFPYFAGRVSTSVRGSEARWVVGQQIGLREESLSMSIQVVCWFSSFFFVWCQGLYRRKLIESDGTVIQFLSYYPIVGGKKKRGLSFNWSEFVKCWALPSSVSYEPVRLQVTFSFSSDVDILMGKLLLSNFRYSQRALLK